MGMSYNAFVGVYHLYLCCEIVSCEDVLLRYV